MSLKNKFDIGIKVLLLCVLVSILYLIDDDDDDENKKPFIIEASLPLYISNSNPSQPQTHKIMTPVQVPPTNGTQKKQTVMTTRESRIPTPSHFISSHLMQTPPAKQLSKSEQDSHGKKITKLSHPMHASFSPRPRKEKRYTHQPTNHAMHIKKLF